MHPTAIQSIRLNRYISDSGLCSRREADRLIDAGQVTINGRRAELGMQVRAGDQVQVQGTTITPRAALAHVYLALNKPVGIECTTDRSVRNNIVDFVGYPERIFPIGRLDKDSQGLILLTNDGEIVNRILRAANRHEKEYIVTVNKPLTAGFLAAMARGVPILDVITQPCKLKRVNATTFRIILTQGLNRQIRRMCEYFGYEVTRLERIRIMNIGLRGLPTGAWRELNQRELDLLLQSVQNSRSGPATPAAHPTRASTSPHPERSNATASRRGA